MTHIACYKYRELSGQPKTEKVPKMMTKCGNLDSINVCVIFGQKTVSVKAKESG
jgi:hypothetical protein